MAEQMIWLRFQDLKARGLFNNRVTLGRWIRMGKFPRPVHLGENTLAWPSDEIERWEEQRRAER